MVEESGEKWSIEHLYRWRRNVLGAPNPYHKTCILSNLHIPIAHYNPKPWFCQTFIAKKPYKFCMIFAGFCRKKYIKVWKIFKNQGKRFDIVMFYILGELVI